MGPVCSPCQAGDHISCVDWAPAGRDYDYDPICDCACEPLLEVGGPDPYAPWAEDMDR